MIHNFTQESHSNVSQFFVAINPDTNDQVITLAQQFRSKHSRVLARIGGSGLVDSIIREHSRMASVKRSARQQIDAVFNNMSAADIPYGQTTLSDLNSVNNLITTYLNALGIAAFDVKTGGIDNIDRSVRYIASSGATSGVHWTSSSLDSISAEDLIITQLAKVGVDGYYKGDIAAPLQALSNIEEQIKSNDELNSYMEFRKMQKFAKSKLAPSEETTALLCCMLLSEYDTRKESVSGCTLAAQHANIVIKEYSRYQYENNSISKVSEITKYILDRNGEKVPAKYCGTLIQKALDNTSRAKAFDSTKMLCYESILYATTDQIAGKDSSYEKLQGLEGAMLGQSNGRDVTYSGRKKSNPEHMGLYLYTEDDTAYGGQATTRNNGRDGFIEINPLSKSKNKWDIVSWHEDIKQDLSDKDLWLVTDEDYSFLFPQKN